MKRENMERVLTIKVTNDQVVEKIQRILKHEGGTYQCECNSKLEILGDTAIITTIVVIGFNHAVDYYLFLSKLYEMLGIEYVRE